MASKLGVDQDVITRLEQYTDFSPTIRLFEFLEVTQPYLTIKQLKDALLRIRRNDLFSLLTTKGIIIEINTYYSNSYYYAILFLCHRCHIGKMRCMNHGSVMYLITRVILVCKKWSIF